MQTLKNLPDEIQALPRFLKTRKDNPKAPTLRDWQKPEKQKIYSELDGILGFVVATENDDSLIFFDFDHVLNNNGEFVNETAEKWFRLIHAEKYFCEQSQSETGLHMFAQPTKGKFTKGRRELNLGNGAKIEIFYGTTKFCLVTGNLFHCSANALIAHGQIADDIFQTVIDEIAKQKRMSQQAMVEQTQTAPAYQQYNTQQQYVPQQPIGIDYNYLKHIISECIAEYFSKQPLNEQATLKQIGLAEGKIKLIDNKGNVYASKLEYKGNLNDRNK